MTALTWFLAGVVWATLGALITTPRSTMTADEHSVLAWFWTPLLAVVIALLWPLVWLLTRAVGIR